MRKIHLNQDELKEILDYDENTGKMRWRINKQLGLIGNEAGTLHHTGYRYISIHNNRYATHRLVKLWVDGSDFNQDLQVDHINQIRDDNRNINLRAVDEQINRMNRSLNQNNTSGYIGVFYHKRVCKWFVKIQKKHYGYFINKQDAIDKSIEVYESLGFHENHGS